MSNADAPEKPAGTPLAASIVERAVAPAIDRLRATQARAADALAGALRDGTLSAPLSPKPLGKLASELIESLSGVDDAD